MFHENVIQKSGYIIGFILNWNLCSPTCQSYLFGYNYCRRTFYWKKATNI